MIAYEKLSVTQSQAFYVFCLQLRVKFWNIYFFAAIKVNRFSSRLKLKRFPWVFGQNSLSFGQKFLSFSKFLQILSKILMNLVRNFVILQVKQFLGEFTYILPSVLPNFTNILVNPCKKNLSWVQKSQNPLLEFHSR